MADDRRRPTTSRDAAEAAFKKATTKPADLPVPRPSIPNAKEMVSLRLDRDILDHFQAEGRRGRDHPFEGTRRTRLPRKLRRVDDQRLPGIEVFLQGLGHRELSASGRPTGKVT